MLKLHEESRLSTLESLLLTVIRQEHRFMNLLTFSIDTPSTKKASPWMEVFIASLPDFQSMLTSAHYE